MSKTIAIITGSLRKESFSKKIANAVREMAPDGFEFKIIPLDDLPVYNQDFDDHDQVPQSYTSYRDALKAADGFIFITPEYNRSMSSVMKNALDVGSRPYGQSVWDGKPGAVFSNSPGNLSAFGANHHLRQCLVFLNVFAMQQPEVYLADIGGVFDEQGKIKNQSVSEFLQDAIDAFVDWFGKFSK